VAPSMMWSPRKLRVGDHPALHEAVALGGAEGVVSLLVVDEALSRFAQPGGER
jgi:deoxyribodipyrimidine photolyase